MSVQFLPRLSPVLRLLHTCPKCSRRSIVPITDALAQQLTDAQLEQIGDMTCGECDDYLAPSLNFLARMDVNIKEAPTLSPLEVGLAEQAVTWLNRYMALAVLVHLLVSDSPPSALQIYKAVVPAMRPYEAEGALTVMDDETLALYLHEHPHPSFEETPLGKAVLSLQK